MITCVVAYLRAALGAFHTDVLLDGAEGSLGAMPNRFRKSALGLWGVPWRT